MYQLTPIRGIKRIGSARRREVDGFDARPKPFHS